MEIKYKNTKSDILSSLNSFYLNIFLRTSVFLGIVIILIVAITYVKEIKPSLNILYFIIVIYFFVFLTRFLIPIIKLRKNLDKLIISDPNYLAEETFRINEDGFEITSKRYTNQQTFNWNSIKHTYSTNKYYLIILYNEKLILINKTNSEPQNILPNIIGTIEQNRKSKVSSSISSNIKQNNKKSNSLYWIGLLGVIPFLGLILGVILSLIGIMKKDFKLILIGVANILFTIFFWLIINQIFNSEIFTESIEKQKMEITQLNLNNLVKEIEFYKTVNGSYPDSLKEIENVKSFIIINEVFESEKPRELYYQNQNESYILKSFGPDKKNRTKDDIYPSLKIDSSKIGLRKE